MTNSKEYNKIYYETTKYIRKEANSMKTHCKHCNKLIALWNMNKHQKTKKCFKKQELNNNEIQIEVNNNEENNINNL